MCLKALQFAVLVLIMSHPIPDIALVVKTRNRGARLEPFFEAIRKMECASPWELVIVDNGSTDSTATELQAFAATFKGHIKIVTEPRRGAGCACNAGWRATEAPIIAFTDDDCYPNQNYLNLVTAVFAEPSLGFIGGRILLFDPTDAPVTINESMQEQFIQAGTFLPAGLVNGANMAFRRQALVDVAGFDDAFGPGTPFVCEEADLTLRVLASGWTGKYDPRPMVYHHHGRKPGSDVDAIYKVYDDGRGAYYLKTILFMPQRWQCARHWARCIIRQSIYKTRRETRSAIHYFFHQLRHRPNTSYKGAAMSIETPS